MPQRNLTEKESRALRAIRNWIVHYGKAPSVRKLQDALEYKSPRTAALLIERLISKGYLQRRPNKELQLLEEQRNTSEDAVLIPLVGTVPCGGPLLAEENVEGWFLVSRRWAKPNHKYFFLTATGTSMNRAGIEEGDLLLVRQQSTAENGDYVVGLIGDAATVKEFRRTDKAVILIPRTSDTEKHRPMLMSGDFQIQGVVEKAFTRDEAQVLQEYEAQGD